MMGPSSPIRKVNRVVHLNFVVRFLIPDDGAPQGASKPVCLDVFHPLGCGRKKCPHGYKEGKGGSDRGSGCIVNLWTGKAAMLRTLRPGLSSIHIDICYGYNTSLEPEPLEATLVHIISQDGAGLRCGLSVYLTRLGSYKTDRDRGCNVKLPRSRNCESDRDRGCIVVLS
ncbi:hypothetical protein V6N13_110233 [Hibiscus sabdariffa]